RQLEKEQDPGAGPPMRPHGLPGRAPLRAQARGTGRLQGSRLLARRADFGLGGRGPDDPALEDTGPALTPDGREQRVLFPDGSPPEAASHESTCRTTTDEAEVIPYAGRPGQTPEPGGV